MTTPTSLQIRAGRALLDWSMMDLAKAARVSISTVKRAENGNTVAVGPVSAEAIREALEVAGVRFLANDGICMAPVSELSEQRDLSPIAAPAGVYAQ